MLIFILAFVGGALTILSPCVLPVLPFVLTQTNQPFRRGGLPLLIGMAGTFAVVAVASGFGGRWIGELNLGGRYVAMAVFFVLGLSLLFPTIADKAMQPLVRLGARLQPRGSDSSFVQSLLIGASTGLLWTPCAGPILGLILAGAAIAGPGLRSAGLIAAFAAGAATVIGVVLFAGARVFKLLKRSLGLEYWIRRALGVAVIVGVVAIAMGWDTHLLTHFSFVNTKQTEEKLIDATRARDMLSGMGQHEPAGAVMPAKLAELPQMPELRGATGWLNSAPLSRESLRGKVVLIDFWTYSCINCLRTLPYVKAWAAKYGPAGLVVIGVHTPEFAFERDRQNVDNALRELGVTYPVAMDNDYKIWKAFNNEYWPAHYLIDIQGRIRSSHFGEGGYDESERIIQQLLGEAGASKWRHETTIIDARGLEAAPSDTVQSPETYVNTSRAARFASPQALMAATTRRYTIPARLTLNHWALAGEWTAGSENTVLKQPGGSLSFRFHARDLNLVLGPAEDQKSVRFRVRLNGVAPGADGGVDVKPDGTGVVRGQRLYQLIRVKDPREQTFEIDFLDPGVHVFAFTFG